MESWTYGEEPPSSARKRMSILYELIQDLKQVEGCQFTVPKRYNEAQPSRQRQLLDIVDSARDLPVNSFRTRAFISFAVESGKDSGRYRSSYPVK